MNIKELSLYVIQEIQNIINESSNEKTLEILAKTYVSITREHSTCQHEQLQEEYDPAYISALGICTLLSLKKDVHNNDT